MRSIIQMKFVGLEWIKEDATEGRVVGLGWVEQVLVEVED